MKRFLLSLSLVAFSGPVLAAPIYLTCKDMAHTTTKTVSASGKPDEVETYSDPTVYNVFINLDQNQGTIDGQTGYQLKVEPATITLSRTTQKNKPEDSRGNRTSDLTIVNFKVNRASLSFDRSYSSLYQSTTNNQKAFRTSLLIMQRAGVPFLSTFEIDRDTESSGSCVKTAPPANNQI